MGERKPERSGPAPEPGFTLEQGEPKATTFTGNGGSPALDFTLRRVLRGRKS